LKPKIREGDSLARLGGDEFGVLLENCPMHEAIRIADELRQCIADFRFVSESRSFNIGASIGVIHVADETLNLTDVLGAADAACYMAKEKGRNRVQFYRPHDSEVFLRRGEMEWYRGCNERSKADVLRFTRRKSFRSKIKLLGGHTSSC